MQYPNPIPPWILEALKYKGLKEIPGKSHNPTILKWLTHLKSWWQEDETPWCGTFVAHCLRTAGEVIPQHWYRAKAYSLWGSPCNKDSIPFGAVCVKSRKGGGHVFFAVARSRDGLYIYGLGGNQSNMVNTTTFKLSDIDSVRWPPNSVQPKLQLPIATPESIASASIGGSES